MSKDRKNLCLSREIVAQMETLRAAEVRSFSTMGEILIREALANRRLMAQSNNQGG
jgi:hypothetical protein